jgi:acetyl esterase
MFLHGGGWISGGFDTQDRLVREIANKANLSAIFVSKTRSPEAKYPVAMEKAYAATKWFYKMVKLLMYILTSSGCWDSVGSNMAGAVALLAKERGEPPTRLRGSSIRLRC